MATSNFKWAKWAALAAVVLGFALLANACGDTDTVLFIRVTGSTAGTISQFNVEVDIDDETRTFRIPESKTVINLPTSFTLQVGPSFTGAANIQVQALNESGQVIGEGMITTGTLAAGKLNTIDVQIAPVVVGSSDGGVRKDAAVDGPANDGAVDAPATDARDGGGTDGALMDAAKQPDATVMTPDAANPDVGAADAGDDAAL